MSESKDESKDESTVGISDDQLPEDLVPSEDNPLAKGLPDGETVEGLLTEGKRAVRSGDEQSDDDQPDEQSDDHQPDEQQDDDASSAGSDDQPQSES